ncbi:TIGR04150 pseudo-rSAM protein [Bacteroides sp.]|uniref:TIGR04150 pseudo-rSAM protein n=1 Tax=Bacteroides sp. TaxID=29523 RepID=UPI0023C55B4E|nr:TIGR04150 pseudo-rSAM protein [Bacteroides sp.]MDE6215810.1 TIGR04150 pseudo-rSAM protein [Bacteroides sp.]
MLYLYTEPYTCYFYKRGKILLYNTLDKKLTLYEVDDELRSIAEMLWKEKGVLIEEKISQLSSVAHFVDVLRRSFNGDILPIAKKQVMPALFHPIVNNQRDFKRLQQVDKISIDNQVMNYLEEVYIYLNGIDEKKEYPAFMQTPSYWGQNADIDGRELIAWLGHVQNKQISQINLLGGDVLNHIHFEEIIDVARLKAHEINLYYRYDLFQEEYLHKLDQHEIDKLYIIVPMYMVDEALLYSKVESLKNWNLKQLIFLVVSEEEYLCAESLIVQYDIKDYIFKPLYNGNNLSFFEKEVFLNIEDIEGLTPTKREIYANQNINRNDFGRITILPNGKIYANPNKEALGIIGRDRVHNVIYRELTEGHSWLYIRNDKPCSDCIYQWLCPSPSNYEQAIGKPNLCHVVP